MALLAEKQPDMLKNNVSTVVPNSTYMLSLLCTSGLCSVHLCVKTVYHLKPRRLCHYR
jgi:hypothetical protein